MYFLTAVLQNPIRITIGSKVVVMALAGFLVSVAGCGGGESKSKFKPFEKTTASGSVTFEGKPVPFGAVSFRHKESGNRSACEIVDGKYNASKGQGPQPGLNMIEIISRQGKDAKSPLLYGGVFRKEATVDNVGYKGDFAIEKKDVKPVAQGKIDTDLDQGDL